jgi:hypothetical protein
MQSSGWIAALLICATAAAHADDDPDAPRQTPFDRGRVSFSISAGEMSALGSNYLSAGVGLGYFVLDGLEIGGFALHEFGSGPSINQVSPSLRYVAQPLVGRWPVIPYAAVFYNHWFLGGGFADLDTVGARTGLLHLSGHLIVGLGIAYERTISTCTSCNSIYPDVTFGFSF